MKDSFHILKHCIVFIYRMNGYILPGFVELTTIQRTKRGQRCIIFLPALYNQTWQNATLNSNKWISGVTVIEFASHLKQMNLCSGQVT